jgi:hypothetical protein
MGERSGGSEMARPQRPRHHDIHKESTGVEGVPVISHFPPFSETNYCRYFFYIIFVIIPSIFSFLFFIFQGVLVVV